jgi:flagellar FliJ protein
MATRLPLDTLLDLAQRGTDEATRQLGRLQISRTNAERQLNLLQDYLQDYRQRMQEGVQQGMSAAGWQNFHRFIATLDLAIIEQQAVLGQAEQQLAHGRTQWQHEKRRLNSFDALAERQRLVRAQGVARREQRDNDEFAARKLAHQRPHRSTP